MFIDIQCTVFTRFHTVNKVVLIINY